jgi:hypothetical protein
MMVMWEAAQNKLGARSSKYLLLASMARLVMNN